MDSIGEMLNPDGEMPKNNMNITNFVMVLLEKDNGL